jgi:hypothetical protein
MPQIDRGSAIHFVLNNMDQLGNGQIMRIENQKNDRFVEIRKFGTRLEILEDGYSSTTNRINAEDLKSMLSKMIEYEFPRSHKLRIKIRKAQENSGLHLSPRGARKH